LKVSNENLPCEHLCGGNKSISCSQLNILQFGTVSNTSEFYTTLFESDEQVEIWKLEFLTLDKVGDRLETFTGDDTLIVEISTQFCDDYGSCTDASVVAVDKGLQIVRSEKL
jgi:hypothetical protein